MKDIDRFLSKEAAGGHGIPGFVEKYPNSKTIELPEITYNKHVFMHLKDRRMKLRLLEALRIRNLDILHRVLADAKEGKYTERMTQLYDDANTLYGYLAKLRLLQHEIGNITRNRLSELQGYTRPPETLQKLMKAVYVILGESVDDLTWNKLRNLMSRPDRYSLLRRVERFNANNLTPDTIEEAKELLQDLKKQDVDSVSNVAAIFFAWTRYVLKAADHVIKIKQRYFQKEFPDKNSRNRKELGDRKRHFKESDWKRNRLVSKPNREEDELTANDIQEDIKKLTRGQLSEVHAFANPPVTIQRVMRATFTVLGETPAELDWKKIRRLMGSADNNSLVKRVENFRISDLNPGAKEYVQETLNGLTLQEVKSVSNVTAKFFAWVQCTMKEAENPRMLKKADLSKKVAETDENQKEKAIKERMKRVQPTKKDLEKEIQQFQKEILKMTRVRITEVHSYSNPPEVVEKVMKAIFTILGEPLTDLTWKKLRGLMSRMDKNSLTKRIENFEMGDLTPEAALIARGFIEDMTFQKVQSVSNVAATFFAWAKYVLNISERKSATQRGFPASQNQLNGGANGEDDKEEDSEEEMLRIREEITKMSRGRISEIHAYSRPPETIEKVMKAVFTILGEPPAGLDWKRMRGLMCRMDKNSLMRRVDGFQLDSLAPGSAETADFFLNDLTLRSVKSVSNVAATLFAWAKCIVKDVDHSSTIADSSTPLENTSVEGTESLKTSDLKTNSTRNSTRHLKEPNSEQPVVPDNSPTEDFPILTKAQILSTSSRRRLYYRSPTNSDASSTKENKTV